MHKDAPKTQLSFARDYVCEDCAQLDAFAVQRTEHCANMQHKTNCEECGRHCYSADMRKRIRAVMRFAGPRMICQHPIEAVRHLLKKQG